MPSLCQALESFECVVLKYPISLGLLTGFIECWGGEGEREGGRERKRGRGRGGEGGREGEGEGERVEGSVRWGGGQSYSSSGH